MAKRKVKTSGRGIEQGRYAAKLLFQFRVVVDGECGLRRLCEERIVLLSAIRAQDALKQAKRRGKAEQHRYRNNEGSAVYFEFVGVLELLRLDPACQSGEVWYEIVERVRPMERKKQLLPPDRKLSAIRNHE